MRQNLENAELEVARVTAKNDAERKNSQFDVDAKQKEFEIASDRLATLNRQIDNSVIYSPGEGLVVYSKVSRGRGDSEPVEEGTSVRQYQTIIILPDNSRLKCKIKVQEAMVDKVRRGMPAHISAEVRPNEVLTGRVTYVAPVADSASRWSGNDKKVYTTEVMLDGINRDESLKAGMKAAATITDTLRMLLLRAAGYETRVVEFVPSEHTAKNTLIRAIRRGGVEDAAMDQYLSLRAAMGAPHLAIERSLPAELAARID